jgi:hypothetical protein
MNETRMIELLSSIDESQKKMLNLLDQLLKLFSKYDDQYLEEMEKEGFKQS